MNQFRDLTMMAMIILAVGLMIGQPENWTWASIGGSYAVDAVDWLSQARPWSVIVLFALSLALFMTRLKY